MEREKLEKLFNQYIDDGYRIIDIELVGNRTITFKLGDKFFRFKYNSFWFGGNGLSTNIEYRAIKGLSI